MNWLLEDSRIVHTKSGESRSFAELATLAQKQAVPSKESLVFKDRDDYRILGKSVSQVDSLEIVTGVGDFGIDTKVDDMLYGTYEKCPAVGGKLVSSNVEDIKKLPGVVDAWEVKGNGNVRELMDGVGIVGTRYLVRFQKPVNHWTSNGTNPRRPRTAGLHLLSLPIRSATPAR